MRKILAPLLLALFLPSMAHAQAPVTQQNRAALTAAINHSFPTNSQGFITAAALRGFLDNFLASITAIYQDTNIISNITLAQVPGLSVKANIGSATGNIADVPLASFFGSAPAGSIPLIALAGGGGGPDFTVSVDGFAPAGAYVIIAPTVTNQRVPLPVQPQVIIYNTGTQAAYVALGGSSVVASTTGDVIQPGSWMEFAVGSNTFLASIVLTGTGSLIISGGTGLATGAGGGTTSGGGGGGGLSVVDGTGFTAGVSAFTPAGGTYNASIPALANGQQGTFALGTNRSLHVLDDNSASLLTAVTSGIPTGTNSIGTVGLNAGTNLIGHIICDTGCATGAGSIPAGSAIIGKVGIDQTTPGTTNGVQVNAALPAGTNVIGHVIADTGSTTAVTALPALPAGSNVIGHAIIDTGSTTAVTALPALPSGTNVIGHVINDASTAVIGHVINDASSAVIGHIIADTGSTTAVTSLPALPAGTNAIGSLTASAAVIGTVGIDQTTLGTTNAVQPIPGTTGGLTTYFVQPTAGDNHANIKNGAGTVYHVTVTNNSATVNYLRLYNAATGFNGCASATNLVYQIAIPASVAGAGFVQDIPMGFAFSTGISICVTSGYATTDTTAATATAMSVTVGYK